MRDASGLQYHRARTYAPGMGVFTARDPYEGDAGRPMSLNGYSWVEGRVVNATDRYVSRTLRQLRDEIYGRFPASGGLIHTAAGAPLTSGSPAAKRLSCR